MVTYEIEGPDGRTYEIDGPEGASREEIIAAIMRAQAPREQAGFADAFKEAATGLSSAPSAAKFAADTTPESRQALLDSQQSAHDYTGFSDISNLADMWNWAKQTAGSSAGYLAAPGAASLGAFLLKGPGVAKGVGLGVLGAQYLVDNLSRQAGTQQQAIEQGQTPKETSVVGAAGAAAGQTALDVVGFKFFSPVFKSFPVVGKMFGAEGEEGAKKLAEDIITAQANGTLKRRNGLLSGMVKGTAFEVPQEIGQQFLERLQAGLPLTDDEARKEYMEAGAGAVLLGSSLGGLKGVIDTHEQKAQAAQIIAMRKQERDNEKEALRTQMEAQKKAQQAAAPAAVENDDQEASVSPTLNHGLSGPIDETMPDSVVAGTGAAPTVQQKKAKVPPPIPEGVMESRHFVGGFGDASLADLIEGAKHTRKNSNDQELTQGIEVEKLVEKFKMNNSQLRHLKDDLERRGVVDGHRNLKSVGTVWEFSKDFKHRINNGATMEDTHEVPPPDYSDAEARLKSGFDRPAGPPDQAAAGASDVAPPQRPAASGPGAQVVEPSAVGVDSERPAAPDARADVSNPALTAAAKLREEEKARIAEERANEAAAAEVGRKRASTVVEEPAPVAQVAPAAPKPVKVKKPKEVKVRLGADAKATVARVSALRAVVPEAHLMTLADIQDQIDSTNKVTPEHISKIEGLEALVRPKVTVKEEKPVHHETLRHLRSNNVLGAINSIRERGDRMYSKIADVLLGHPERNAKGETRTDSDGVPYFVGGVEEEDTAITEGEFDPAPKIAAKPTVDKKSPYLSQKHWDAAESRVTTVNMMRNRKRKSRFANVHVEGSIIHDRKRIEKLKAEGRVAEYDPATNSYAFTKEGLTDRVVMHEVIHAFTVKALKQFEQDPESMTLDQQRGAEHVNRIMNFTAKTLAQKYPDAYVNVHEFAAHAMTEPELQADLAKIRDPLLVQYTEFKTHASTAWSAFTNAIFKLLRLAGLAKGNAMIELSEAINDILRVPERTKGVAPLSKMADRGNFKKDKIYVPDTKEEVIKKFAESNLGFNDKDLTVKTATKFLFGHDGYEWLVRKFHNDRRPLKVLEEFLLMTGHLITDPKKAFNNLYTLITLSTGRSKDILNMRLMKPMNDVHRAIEKYATANGLDIKTALGKLQLYAMAVHEEERRHTKYLLNVPLDIRSDFQLTPKEVGLDKWIKTPNYKDTAAGYRQTMIQVLSDAKKDANGKYPYQNGMADDFRAALEYLAKNHANNVTGATTLQRVAVKNMSLDESDRVYDVVGEYSQDEFKQWRKDLQSDHKAEFEEVMSALKRVQEASIKIDEDANYWSVPTHNFKVLYGWKNYVPFKGRPVSDSDERFDFNNKRMNGELVENATAFEGRESDPENPILRTLLDATRSAMRLGRHGTSEAIKNLIKQKMLAGEAGKVYTFHQMYSGYVDPTELKGPNIILHHTGDGTVEVYHLHTKTAEQRHMRDAIRRAYSAPMPFVGALNYLTSTIGHLHTRYNQAFHPYNFVRDLLTNAFTMGAEQGLDKSGALLKSATGIVLNGGFTKAWRITQMYNDGDVAGLEKYLANDPVGQDMLEFLHSGGEVTYVQGLALKGQFQELLRDIGKDRFIKTKDQFNKYVDQWTAVFELTSRASTYSVVKAQALADGMTEDEARQKAATYAKNLMNFEQVGEWGRQAGAVFMFFRPAATGAVRAIDALAPAFQDVQTLIDRLPKGMREDKDAIAKLKKEHAERKKNAQVMVTTLAGSGFAAYMMAFMAADEDEVGRNIVATDDMALWTRNLRLPLGFMGGEGYLQLPWGFGLGAVAASGAQIAAWSMGTAKTADVASNLLNIGLDSFLPVPVSRIDPLANPGAWFIDSLMPSAVRPVVEYQMNTDSLGREIFNDRTNKYGDAYTGGANIPPMYMGAARTLTEITNGGLTLQPETLNFWANNYADGLARVAHTSYGIGLLLGGEKGFDAKTDVPGFSSYIGRRSNYDGKRFAQLEETLQKKKEILGMFEHKPKELAEYVKRHPNDQMMVQIYDKYINRGLKKLRHDKNIIVMIDNGYMIPAGTRLPNGTITEEPTPYNDKLRREYLKENTLMQNALKRQLIDCFKEYGLKL